LVLIYGLALLALVSVALLFPDVVANALLTLGTISPTARAIAVAVIDLAIVIALFLLIRAPRREEMDGLIVKTPGARADINITSARELILKAVRDVPNVVSADAKLTAPAGKADIDMAVEVVGDNVNIPNKQREIDRALRQVALKQLGLQLATQPRVHIQLVTEQELRAREEAARPQPLPPPPPARETWTPTPAVTPQPWTPPPAPPVEPVTPVVAAVTVAEVVTPPVVEEPVMPDFTPEPEAPVSTPLAEAPVEVEEGLLVAPSPESELADSIDDVPLTFEEDLASDDTLDVPPLETVVPLDAEPEPEHEIDISVLDEITPETEDWLTVDSSPEEETGLYAADDVRSRRETEE
jgi:hypothetical protein